MYHIHTDTDGSILFCSQPDYDTCPVTKYYCDSVNQTPENRSGTNTQQYQCKSNESESTHYSNDDSSEQETYLKKLEDQLKFYHSQDQSKMTP